MFGHLLEVNLRREILLIDGSDVSECMANICQPWETANFVIHRRELSNYKVVIPPFIHSTVQN